MDNELFELCKEVYKKTGWQIEDCTWVVGDENGDLFILDDKVKEQGHFDYYTPLYTSDYLLEKLPNTVHVMSSRDGCAVWLIESSVETVKSDTPRKALLKLVLALKEAGEIK